MVAGTSKRRHSGQAQWCPTRTATPSVVEHLPDVVRVDAVDDEGDRSPAGDGVGGPMTRTPVDLGQPVERVAGEPVLVGGDRVHADRGEVVDRGTEPDGLRGHRARRPRTAAAAARRS